MSDSSYTFRLRFHLSPSDRLPFDEPEFRLTRHDGAKAILQSAEMTRDDENDAMVQEKISRSAWLILGAREYETEEKALIDAGRWRGVLEQAFACLGIAADFGDRAASGFIGSDYAAQYLAESGHPLLWNAHGLLVYRTEPSPIFAEASARLVMVTQPSTVLLAVHRADGEMTPERSLAFDLFAVSEFVAQSPDARFVVLMMAFEAMVVQKRRPDQTCSHLDELISLTHGSELEEGEKGRLKNALGSLKKESVAAAADRLAGELDGRLYAGMSPSEFMRRCYRIRHGLVHGSVSRPARDEVASLGAALENFVGHLIAGRALVEELLAQTA